MKKKHSKKVKSRFIDNVDKRRNKERGESNFSSSLLKNILVWGLIVSFGIMILSKYQYGSQKQQEYKKVPYSEFINMVRSNSVMNVEISDKEIYATTQNNMKVLTYMPMEDHELLKSLIAKNIEIKGSPAEQDSMLSRLMENLFPTFLGLFLWFMLIKHMSGGKGGGIFGFGKSKAKMQIHKKAIYTTFEDVAGIEEAKEEITEIVQFLKNPEKFQKLGGKMPSGVLLLGLPGTGKTLLAKAVAGEAGVPFFSTSGSDFMEMFVGVGASRVRSMFEEARKNAPCIIFIDEIDAIGRHRGAGLGGGHDEREQTLNQILVEMDGFEGRSEIVVIAATNRPDVLDPALLRPGRFDRQIVVQLPDIKGREQILKVHAKKIHLSKDIDFVRLAQGTPGFSGADIENLVNEAALISARNGKKIVGMEEFEKAKDRIIMGAERRSIIMSIEEKRMTAYHEAGHAIIGLSLPYHDPIYKVSIIPRGRALGVTMFIPDQDRHSMTKVRLENQISVMFGGRIAELLVFGNDMITTGASNDIERATEIARNMVTHWGFSDVLGPMSYSEDESEIFLGKSITRRKEVSNETSSKIDKEIRTIIDKNYERAKMILESKISILHKVADVLMTKETIETKQILEIMYPS